MANKKGRQSIDDSIRYQIVALSATGLSNRAVGDQLNVSEKCVRTTLSNNKTYGAPLPLKSPGRPRKLGYRDENWIYRKVRMEPSISNQEIAHQFNKNHQEQSVSRDTIRRALKRRGISTYVATRKPRLKPSDRIKRRAWCKAKLHWTVEDWAKVIFSDESNFEVLNRKSRILIKRLSWEKYEERFVQPMTQGGGGIIILMYNHYYIYAD